MLVLWLRAIALGAILLGAILLGPRGEARADERPAASALLEGIRAEERGVLAEELGVGSLDELPLYDLHLAIDDELRGFGLRERVFVRNGERAPMREVVLRVYANAAGAPGTEPPVRLLEGRCHEGASCTFTQPSPSVIVVRPSAPLAPGAQLDFELDLQGVMVELDEARLSMMGQGLESFAALSGTASDPSSGYGLLSRGAGIGSLAAFYPVLARRRRGAWVTDDGGTTGDLSSDAVHHVVARVVVPEDVVVASSGVEVSVADVADPPARARRKEITIHAAAVREFALLASRDFVVAERRDDGVRIRAFALEADRAEGEHVADVARAAFEVFGRRFGRYPYTELDVVEAPLVGGAGGVEFSGLVTVAVMFHRDPMVGLSGLLGGLGAGGPSAGGVDASDLVSSMREFVTAHEVAHQWWHGLVGSDSREHPFLDESLAQYAAMLYLEERYGDERAEREGERQVAMNYRMMRARGEPDGAVDRPASAFRTPIAYAGLVYGKGPYFYRAVRERIGDTAFFAGLASYVAAHRFREAVPDDVVSALASATPSQGREVRRLARRWLEERHGDEDLGRGDPRALARSMMPPELAGVFDDPEMGPLLEQMLGGVLGSAGGAGGAGSGAPFDLGALLRGIDAQAPGSELSPEMLEFLERTLSHELPDAPPGRPPPRRTP